jgi:putative DNA primase/helicase
VPGREIEFGHTLPYLHAARLYLAAGWSPLPLRRSGPRAPKGVPPAGFTCSGRMATEADVAGWMAELPGAPVGIRLPDGVMGIDVDAYLPKHGSDTLSELENLLGPLPPAWWSTARDDEISGIRFYRVPSGMRFPGKLGRDVEVIWHGYRFARCWPSLHPTGEVYRWYRPDGSRADGEVPVVSELPELPEAWVEFCRAGKAVDGEEDGWDGSIGTDFTSPDIARLIQSGMDDEMCHDSMLRDVVWVLARKGYSDEEIYRHWQTIVDKTPLKDPGWPFTRDYDFEKRHMRRVRDKQAKSRQLDEGQQAWLDHRAGISGVNGANGSNGSRAAAPAPMVPVVSEAQLTAQLVEAMIIRGEDGSISHAATHEDLPRSDMSTADFIAGIYPGIFTFSTQSRFWRFWDGTVHSAAEDGNVPFVIRRFARAYKDVMREIQRDVIRTRGDDETEAEAMERYQQVWRKHRTYRDAIWMNPGQVRVARQLEQHLSVSEVKFDAISGMVVASNGVISISAAGAVVLPHDRDNLVTLRLGEVSYRHDAQAPVFQRFLETSVPDEEHRGWLQRSLGMALIGKPGKSFINLIGRTNSGKSTFVRALQGVLGTYASPVSVETFLEGNGNNDFRLHSLKGVRFAFASEPAAGRKLDTEAIKSITGGDMQETRQLYGRFVTWKPSCLIVIASNQPQRFDTADTAMMERISPIAFSQAHAIDPDLDVKLAAEKDGILKWLIDGAVMELGGTAAVSKTMLKLREAMAEHVDDCLRFIAEGLEEGWLREDGDAPTSRCAQVNELYRSYQLSWCPDEGIRYPVGRKAFSAKIGRRYPVQKSNGYRFTGLTYQV